VAFDASCEEMWLAWRHGACLVPAPRSLVRTGVDLGPWLVAQRITVVSTVPTLAALWPVEALDDVRLLIFGGEACPPELAERLAVEGREVWNTYGPTEATVVACAAQLTGTGPVRIGLPLSGWELAVVDGHGDVVPMGGVGELVIGGVGLARYLDGGVDARTFAPALGWPRAYRSGDLVRAEPAGLVPVIAVVDSLPTRTSGKVDRNALPWPLPLAVAPSAFAGTEGWVAERWADVLGTPPAGPDEDFFAAGGSSLGAARLVSLL